MCPAQLSRLSYLLKEKKIEVFVYKCRLISVFHNSCVYDFIKVKRDIRMTRLFLFSREKK